MIRAAELALSGVFGFGLVWLTFLKDYRKFRGLFPRLFRCSDAWCFLIIATAIVCALDVGVLLYLVYKTHLDSLVIEFYVAVVHPVLSSVSAAVLPPILHLLPQGPKVDRAFDPWTEPDKQNERRVSEMNAISGAIYDFLDQEKNAEVEKWLGQYDWEKIKYQAHALIDDRIMAGRLTPGAGEQWHQRVDAPGPWKNQWEERRHKREVVAHLIELGSVRDVRSRLACP